MQKPLEHAVVKDTTSFCRYDTLQLPEFCIYFHDGIATSLCGSWGIGINRAASGRVYQQMMHFPQLHDTLNR